MTGALPCRLATDGDEPTVEWVWSDGGRFTEPFFEETVARLSRANPANQRINRPRTPLAALRDVPPGLPLAGLIFHVSRCGSTLIARMLAALPRNLVASEPQVIDEILRFNRVESAITDDDQIALLRGAVNALSQPPAGGAARFFAKLDCWQLFSLPLIQRAFPGVPLLFVYRDPIEVLVSLMRRPSLTLVRDTIAPEKLGLTIDERNALSREEYAAAILGAFYRVATAHRSKFIPIAYSKLPAVLPDLAPGGPYSEVERVEMLSAAQTDAKNPTVRFAPDSARKRDEATSALQAAAAKWAQPAYRKWLGVV